LLSVPAEPLKEKIDRLIYKGWEPLFKKIKLFKNVKETLFAMRDVGYKLGVLSDFPPETKLEYLGVSGIWDATLCSERCGALKPHSKSFIDLAQAMALPPENILYVGNSHKYDVTGAAMAGMKTAWIVSGLSPGIRKKQPKPDFYFNNYRQLYNFMLL
jgi:putative hydrolase of the HAD superfamily